MVLPSVNDPNVLVLQGVKKAARGNYSCRVGNGIPTHDYEVESEPIFLDVKCKSRKKKNIVQYLRARNAIAREELARRDT